MKDFKSTLQSSVRYRHIKETKFTFNCKKKIAEGIRVAYTDREREREINSCISRQKINAINYYYNTVQYEGFQKHIAIIIW